MLTTNSLAKVIPSDYSFLSKTEFLEQSKTESLKQSKDVIRTNCALRNRESNRESFSPGNSTREFPRPDGYGFYSVEAARRPLGASLLIDLCCPNSSKMEFAVQEYGCPIKENQIRATLSELLAPRYVEEAFTLPPTSHSIWSIIELDIEREGGQIPFFQSIEDELLPFLKGFFAPGVVEQVSDDLKFVSLGSFLGSDYVLRRGKVVIGQMIVKEIVRRYVLPDDGGLKNFLGTTQEDDVVQEDSEEDWTRVSTTRSRKLGSKGRGSGGAGSGGAGRRGRGSGGAGRRGSGAGSGGRGSGGGGRRGGQRSDNIEFTYGAPFRRMEVIDVDLPSFHTPPKPPPKPPPGNPESVKEREFTLNERSFLFKMHGAIDEPLDFLYDPMSSTQSIIHLYHGMRCSSIDSFRDNGVKPGRSANEFSAGPAFYLTNSVQHAYEHPLHVHPGWRERSGRSNPNPPAVLVFELDANELHGEKELTGSLRGQKFNIRWFQDGSDENEWLRFCTGNMKGLFPPHDYDIVIGGMCKPHVHGPKEIQGGNLGKPEVVLTQVAFCSIRAQRWVGELVKKVYCERRATDEAQ